MKEICKKKECTGCGLCVALCPIECIKMDYGQMGHVYPKIDNSICINCGLCKKKCPANTETIFNNPLKAYAIWSKDAKTYKESASGGLATEISRFIIQEGGVVYGCASLPDIEIKHIRVDKTEDIVQLQGSKYVQSSIIDIIPLLKKDIKAAKTVCFIGTPCQVAAIKNIYKEQPVNLLLIDIICHGVPSLQELKKHVRRIAGNNPIDKVVLRKKGEFGVYIYSKGQEIYSYTLFDKRFFDCYINAFYDSFTYRDSCYRCKYAQQHRVSDITIGDFWGLGEDYNTKEMPEHKDGCSLALPLTAKGLSFLTTISHNLNIYERTIEEAVSGNDQLRHPSKYNNRIRIYRYVQTIGYMPWVYHILISDIILWPKVKGLFRKIIKILIWQK